MSMRGPRYEHILATTALALILAAPPAGMAKDAQLLSSPAAAPAKQTSTQGSPAAASPANVPAAVSPVAPADPATTVQQTAAPDPLASLDPADRVIAEKIRDLLSTKAESIFVSKTERTAVQSFYQGRSFAPLWLDKGVENARAKSAIARLNGA